MSDMNLQDSLQLALRRTQELRASVSQLFDHLSKGMKRDSNEEEKGNVFILEVQRKLLTVNNDLSDLEKTSNLINSPTNNMPVSLGNTNLISLDPVLDKTPLFSQVLQTYKWTNKMHDHATIAHTLLQPNQLKRSQTGGNSAAAKRARKAFNPSHSVPTQIVDNLVQTMMRTHPDMTIVLTRPMGSPAVLQITLDKQLKAIVVLRGLIIEYVAVKGYDEDFTTENGKLDIWSKSKHAVFRKVTDHTMAAMLHFYSPIHHAELAVKSFMKWLQSYKTLFSVPCCKCGKFLQENLPPTWRGFRYLDAYHDNCRP